MTAIKSTQYSILVLIVIAFFACNSSADADKNNSTEASKIAANDEHADQADHPHTITLNNGQRWKANTETTRGIERMTVLIEGIPQHAQNSDFDSLRVALDKEFNIILQKCTMTGASHDQLHNYLLPLAELIKKLDSPTIKANEKTTNEIRHYLLAYHQYFE